MVEAVDQYSVYNPGWTDLQNNADNVNGFLYNMIPTAGIWWTTLQPWYNAQVYDSDFYDPQRVSGGSDTYNFDQASAAISFFSGHGSCDDQTSTTCFGASGCPPQGGNIGVCTRTPMNWIGRCEYSTPRRLVTASPADAFGHNAFYSSGNVKLGESSNAGTWGGAGTNGNTNMAIFDVSCGATPNMMYQNFSQAFAGASLIGTIMPAHTGADTADVDYRGWIFGYSFRVNPYGSVGSAWVNTINTSGGGAPCLHADGSTTPGHGIIKCGVLVVASLTESAFWTGWALNNESWYDIQFNVNDARAGTSFNWKGICNWNCAAYPGVMP